MNNKYILGMSEIKTDEQLKNKIICNIKQCSAKQAPRFFSLKKAVSIAAVACAFAFVVTFGIPFVLNNHDTKKQGQAGVETLFKGFALTVYAADGSPVEIKPDADFLLGKYQMTMNRAPGFPVKIVCDEADTIKVTGTDGAFLLWGAPDWKVQNKGKELEIKSGDTVYWTPASEANADDIAAGCTIMIKAYKNNKELGSNSVRIDSEDQVTYTGRLSE